MQVILPDGPLVSSAWLAAHLGHPDVRILDTRGQVVASPGSPARYLAKYDAYRAAHIPGAAFIDWTRDTIDPDDPVPVQVAPPERIARLFGRLGIGDQTVVITYDDSYSTFAGRLLWVLRYYGHEAARVLDGGLTAWSREGLPLTAETPSFAPAVFTPRPRPELRATASGLLAGLLAEHQSGRAPLLLDARGSAEYSGQAGQAARLGHIPGAVSAHYRGFVSDTDHRFAAPEQLRERLRAAGIDLDGVGGREVVAYCNGGVSATATALALEIVTGTRAAIYDGSWNEWGNAPNLPVERG